jgi:hypothetical protein
MGGVRNFSKTTTHSTCCTAGRLRNSRQVGKRVELSLQYQWGGRALRTQIVVIGAAGGIDAELLRGQFQKAVAPNQTLQQTGAACSRFVTHSSPSGPGC